MGSNVTDWKEIDYKDRSAMYKPKLAEADTTTGAENKKGPDGKLSNQELTAAVKDGGKLAFMMPGATPQQIQAFGNTNSVAIKPNSTPNNGTNPQAPTTQSATSGPSLSRINAGDHGNAAAMSGIPRSMLESDKNTFFEIKKADGTSQIGFYSSGHGAGDERSGVIEVGKDGKVTLAGGVWKPADKALTDKMKEVHALREKEIKDNYGGAENYKAAQRLLADIGDLKASGVLTEEQTKNLDAMNKALSPTGETKLADSDLQTQKSKFSTFIDGDPKAATLLKNNRLDELAAQHGEEFVKGLRAGLGDTPLSDLDTKIAGALKEQTVKAQKLDDQGEKSLSGLKDELTKALTSDLLKKLPENSPLKSHFNSIFDDKGNFRNPDHQKQNLAELQRLKANIAEKGAFRKDYDTVVEAAKKAQPQTLPTPTLPGAASAEGEAKVLTDAVKGALQKIGLTEDEINSFKSGQSKSFEGKGTVYNHDGKFYYDEGSTGTGGKIGEAPGSDGKPNPYLLALDGKPLPNPQLLTRVHNSDKLYQYVGDDKKQHLIYDNGGAKEIFPAKGSTDYLVGGKKYIWNQQIGVFQISNEK
jgi:hypothetical protein